MATKVEREPIHIRVDNQSKGLPRGGAIRGVGSHDQITVSRDLLEN